jgi:hypothetical protein
MTESQHLERISGLVEKYDAELSIEARRILRWEAHCASDCIELAWKPTLEFLEQLAKQKPKFLLCARSKPFYPNQNDGECVDVDLISPDFKTAYLGMVVNIKQAISVWNRSVINCFDKIVICADALPEKKARELFDSYASKHKKLLADGPLMILRENNGCFIPVETDRLSRRTAEKGVRKILAVLMPCLAKLPIHWAPSEEQKTLEKFIEREARERAVSQTDRERQDIFRRDAE